MFWMIELFALSESCRVVQLLDVFFLRFSLLLFWKMATHGASSSNSCWKQFTMNGSTYFYVFPSGYCGGLSNHARKCEASSPLSLVDRGRSSQRIGLFSDLTQKIRDGTMIGRKIVTQNKRVYPLMTCHSSL